MPVDRRARETERLREALRVLGQADQALEGWSCPASTECCRFSITGREPYLTEAEWAVLVQELARQGRKVPGPREDGDCAFLADGRCTVYAARPLGCRTFYCDRASGYGSYPRRQVAPLPGALEALSRPEHGRDRKGRPLSSWLRDAARR